MSRLKGFGNEGFGCSRFVGAGQDLTKVLKVSGLDHAGCRP